MGYVKEYLADKIEDLAEKVAPKLSISKEAAYDWLWDEWADRELDLEGLDHLVEELLEA